MPHAFRVYTSLKGEGVDDVKALAVATLVAVSKAPDAIYNEDAFVTLLCDADFTEPAAEAICRSVANCFLRERFNRKFDPSSLKLNLVRTGWAAPIASTFLEAIRPCVITPLRDEVRAPIKFAPSQGRVVMCDFSFLKRPEMQKERRAIVVSTRAASGIGRCTVVPVSMTPSLTPNPHHHLFLPGSYNFFHPSEPVWAVCDHIYTVSLERLWHINIRDKPVLPTISPDDLAQIKLLVGNAIGVNSLT